MVRSHTGRGALLSSNLPQLQNLIKRDSVGYKEEFLQQWNHYQSIRKIFHLNPDSHSQQFREMVTFIAQVAQHFPSETAEFPAQISTMLMENFGVLDSDTRKCLVSNLIILRKKGVIESIDLLKALFPLLPRTQSSSLRAFIRKSILTDIRTANQKRMNHKLNRSVQALLFRMIEQDMTADIPVGKPGPSGRARASTSSEDPMWAVFLTKDLWTRGIWNDAKSVSIIALGCFHPNVKVQSASLHFFLGDEEEAASSDEEEDEGPNIKALQHRREINKKTKAGERKMAKSVKVAKKKRRKQSKDGPTENLGLRLLQDPQTFAEKLYDNLSQNDKRYTLEHKVLIMQVLSRAVGMHMLCVLGFFSYIVKYLTYHQLQIPNILASLAQAVHELTPPDELVPVVRKISAEFVHPGVASEVIASGLNAIREVCKRQPWCMEEDLLADLVEYKKSKDKGVITAARGLLQLYRQALPTMLKRRERGKEASMKLNVEQPLPFGHQTQDTTALQDLTLLEHHYRGKVGDAEEGNDEDADDDWNGWEVDSDSSESSESSGGWIDVSSDSEHDLVLSDSDDEDNRAKHEAAPRAKPEEASAETNAAEDHDFATTKIFTPADFAMLDELRDQASKDTKQSTSDAKRKRGTPTDASSTQFVSEGDILGPRKKPKADYAERLESIARGREGREKFGSTKGKKNKDAQSSSTNREKARNKPLMMVLASNAVRGKKKASLRDKQKRLRAHTERSAKRKR